MATKREVKTYTARPSAPFPKSAATSIGRRLDLLARKHGGMLKPEHVVEDARDPASPCHKYFKWDVSEAAQEYWLAQARRIIGAIEVVVILKGGDTPVRRFHNVVVTHDENSKPDRGYVTLEKIESDEGLRNQVAEAAVAFAEHLLSKFRSILESSNAIGDVERIIKKIRKLAA